MTSDKQAFWRFTGSLGKSPATCERCRWGRAGSLVSADPRESPSKDLERSIWWYCDLWQAGMLALHCSFTEVYCHMQALPVD